MQAFAPKGRAETRTRTVALSADLIAAGVTFVSPIVTAEVYTDLKGNGTDPSPSAIISGAATRNASPFALNGVQIGVNQAATQIITAGVNGCTYVLRYRDTLSNGEIWEEDVIQLVTKYVPPSS